MIKNMGKKICKATVLLPVFTLFLFAGFIGSLLIPNTVLDTYVINMTEEEGDAEVLLPLSLHTPLMYEMDTNGRSMKGIQIGIDKRGIAYQDAVLSYQVYLENQLVSDNVYDLTTLEDVQYVYLPFADYEGVNGQIQIRFLINSCDQEVLPGMIANHKDVKGTKTICQETFDDEHVKGEADSVPVDISLKGNHIYTHETYPFLYEFRILSFLFLAVTMTVAFPVKKKESEQEEVSQTKKEQKKNEE